MQQNNSADRTIVAGYSGDDPPVPHIGVSDMVLGAIMAEVCVLLIWVTDALLLFFAFKGLKG
jgi:hypothetical protein